MVNRRVVVVALGLGSILGCRTEAGPVTVSPADGATALVSGSPTVQLRALERQIDEQLPGAEAAQCRAWSEELVGLHEAHGEPYVEARLLAGTALHRCGLPDEAERVLTDTVDTMPRWARAQAFNTLAVIAHERGDFGEATARLFEALAADPVLRTAQDNLIRIMTRRYVETHSALAYDEAMQRTSDWIVRAPDDAAPQLHRARLLALHGRTSPESVDEAEVLLSELLRRDLSDRHRARAYTIWAEIHLGQGDETKALRFALRAAELDPRHAPALLLAGYCKLRMRDFYGATDLLTHAEGWVDPYEEHDRLRALAVAYRGLRRYDDAEKIYALMAERWPDDPVDLYNRSHFDLLRFNDGETFEPEVLKRAKEGFSRVVELTDGEPRHRAMHDQAKREHEDLRRMYAPTVHRGVYPEQVRLEELERERMKEERVRLLKIEARAREAWEREHPAEASPPKAEESGASGSAR